MSSKKIPDSTGKINNPLDGELGYHLRRASNMMYKKLNEALKKIDLNVPEASALLFIAENPNIKQVDIGRQLGVKRANMAPLMSNLRGQNQVKQISLDGRSHGFSVSVKGKESVKKIKKCIRDSEEWISKGLSAEERENMIQHFKGMWEK